MGKPARTVRVVDLAGPGEIQRMLGINRAVFARWRDGRGVPEPLPKPIKKLKTGEIWDKAEIREWLERVRPREEGV